MLPALQRNWKRIHIGAIITVFILSRWAFHTAGLRFDPGPLEAAWQVIDTALMRERLLESIWYLHSQPPLFNLFLGAVLKLTGSMHALAFQLSYALLSLGMILALDDILANLPIHRIPRLVFLYLFMCSPPVIIYENWLFYTMPVAAFFIIAVLFLVHFLRGGGRWYALGFHLTLAAIVFMRASFHLLWYIACGVLVMAALYRLGRSAMGRRFLIAGIGPLVLILALYGKNYYLFDQFGASTWLGMNWARVTVEQLPPETRRELTLRKKLSVLGNHGGFGTEYPEKIFHVAPRGIRVLDTRKTSTGRPNYNYAGYINVSRLQLGDSLYVVRNHTALYALAAAKGLYLFFAPSFAHPLLAEKIKPIHGLVKFYLRYFYAYRYNLPVYILVPTLLGLLHGFVHLIRIIRGRAESPAVSITAGVLCLTILYVMLVSILFEHGENMRFRFAVEAPSYILFLMFAAEWARRLRALYSRVRSRKEQGSGT